MANTVNMNLPLPTVGVTPGPDYGNDNNDSFTLIDEHDHTSGKGVKVPVAGLNIDAALPVNSNDITLINSALFDNLSADISTVRGVYVKNGELFYRDNVGNAVQITANGGLDVSTGNIAGLVAPASATYAPMLKTFIWEYDTAKAARMASGDLQLYPYDGSTAFTEFTTIKTDSTLGTPNTVTLPKEDGTIGTDFGAVPLGSIVCLMSVPGLTGYWPLPAPGVVSNGWMRCDGSVIPGGNAVQGTVPNVTQQFIYAANGSTVFAGDTGGNNSQSSSISGSVDLTHRHNFAHSHQWQYINGNHDFYSLASSSPSNTTFTAIGSPTTPTLYYNLSPISGTPFAGTGTANVSFLALNEQFTSGALDPPLGSSGANAETTNSGINVNGASFSIAAWDNRPAWTAGHYIIRVN